MQTTIKPVKVKASARTPKRGLELIDGHFRLAAQDPARLRFKLQKKPSAFTNPESSNQQGLFQLCIDGGDQQAHTLPR